MGFVTVSIYEMMPYGVITVDYIMDGGLILSYQVCSLLAKKFHGICLLFRCWVKTAMWFCVPVGYFFYIYTHILCLSSISIRIKSPSEY